MKKILFITILAVVAANFLIGTMMQSKPQTHNCRDNIHTDFRNIPFMSFI